MYIMRCILYNIRYTMYLLLYYMSLHKYLITDTKHTYMLFKVFVSVCILHIPCQSDTVKHKCYDKLHYFIVMVILL